MLTENQIQDQFQGQLGRQATPYELTTYAKASPQVLASLKGSYSALNTEQSIVDYLKYTGADPGTLPELAKKYGVEHIGTAEGNTQLLRMLKSGQPAPTPAVGGSIMTPPTPSPAATPPQGLTTEGGATLNPDGTVQTPAPMPGAETPESPPRVPGIDQALSSYQSVQKQIAEIDNSLNNMLEERKRSIAASGGVINESQLRSELLAEQAPLVNQRKALVSQQSIAGKQYTELLTQQREADANFYKTQAEKDKQIQLNQAQQKIDATAAQNEIKNTQAEEKMAQAGFKLSKVNVTDGAGNVLGQRLVWSQNPASQGVIAADNAAATVKTSAGSGGVSKSGVTTTGNTTDMPKLSLADGATPEQVLQSLISGKPVAVKGSTVPFSQQTLYVMAVNDLLGIPSSVGGRVPSGAIAAVKNKETDIMNAYGLNPFDVAAAKEQFKGMTAANSDLLGTAAFTKTYAATAKDNLQLAIDQSAKVPRSGSKLKNNYTQWAQGNFTPAGDLAEFETYIYTAAREYAKVTSGGAKSSAGLTDSASAEVSKLINAAQSPEAFAQVTKAMQRDMDNVINNFDKQTSAYPDAVKKLFGPAAGGEANGRSSLSDADITFSLQSAVGRDGKVSPDDWKTLEDLYVTHGGTAEQFTKQYGSFKNPKNPNYQ